ncbi:hypothetical protein [Oribacterium sp. NK2B42]|uniref:hypothetical protein n=1 Tax=Oribacterium sp. NK2B42 TaxID=689781 RepID=UPI000423FC80|nr:hypothetical protein [Oribacterium sp. NK2B42]
MKRYEHMNVVYNKLRSKSGASIILALLLVLITSTVGVVILSSGTAASGRMARLWEDERHYMLVTSAADVLIDEINGKKVTIEIKRTTGESTSYSFSVNGKSPGTQDSLLTRTARCFIFGENGEPSSQTDYENLFNAESLFSVQRGDPSVKTIEHKYKIHTDINGNTNDVNVKLTLVKSDGSFDAELSSSKSSAKDVYSINIRFIPTFKEGYTIESQTEVKKYEIWWEAQEIEVG